MALFLIGNFDCERDPLATKKGVAWGLLVKVWLRHKCHSSDFLLASTEICDNRTIR